MGAVLARWNFMERQAGPRMFKAVLIFGLANLGFGAHALDLFAGNLHAFGGYRVDVYGAIIFRSRNI